MAPKRKKPIDISKAKASEIFFPDNEKEKDQVDDGEEGSAQEEDAEDENEPDGSGTIEQTTLVNTGAMKAMMPGMNQMPPQARKPAQPPR